MLTSELVRKKHQEAAKRNRLKGHDKSGQSKRNSPQFAAPIFVPGGHIPDTSAGISRHLKVFSTPQSARRALVKYYTNTGMYHLGRNNELIPTAKNPDKRIIVLPKKSKMPRIKIGKAGRAMSKHGHDSGIIL